MCIYILRIIGFISYFRHICSSRKSTLKPKAAKAFQKKPPEYQDKVIARHFRYILTILKFPLNLTRMVWVIDFVELVVPINRDFSVAFPLRLLTREKFVIVWQSRLHGTRSRCHSVCRKTIPTILIYLMFNLTGLLK
jgi:hypothetical protein